LRIIEEEQLVAHASAKGEEFLTGLCSLAQTHPFITAPRGRGLMLAFDLPDTALRDTFWKSCYELGLLVVRGGVRTIRLRPVLDVQDEILEESLRLLHAASRKMAT
jgi:L-lysine 6-transaminase